MYHSVRHDANTHTHCHSSVVRHIYMLLYGCEKRIQHLRVESDRHRAIFCTYADDVLGITAEVHGRTADIAAIHDVS